MIVCAFVLSIWMNFGLVKCFNIPNILPSIMEEFTIYQPTIISSMLKIKEITEVVKNFNHWGYSIGFSQNQLINQYQSSVIFTDILTKFKWNNPTYAPILVVSKIATKEDLKEVDVSIGSEVLFLDGNSFKVYESYTINEIKITRYLGQFRPNNKMATIEFLPSIDYISNMESRRCDFYGIQLTGAVSWLSEDPINYSNIVQFFPNNDTYDITKLANDPKYHEMFWNILEVKILKIMENKLNFSSKFFLRRDMKTGSPYISSNGSSVIGEGVFKDLWEGSTEFASDSFIMSPIRLQFVDFLPIVWDAHDTIFIQIEDSSEAIDWKVFLKPFAIEVWLAIAIKCIIFTLVVSFIEWFHDYKLVRANS